MPSDASRGRRTVRKSEAPENPAFPATPTLVRAIEAWFATHQRPLPWRLSYDPYHVWVSEVMLQQTRMEVVLRYYAAFLERFPDLASLASASDDEVTSRWSGLGYYRRARMLRAGAVDVIERFAGTIPETAEELASITGIGRYTAGAIASIAYGRRAPIVDGNVARIVARLYGIDAPVGSPALMKAAWEHAATLVEACRDPRALNQGLMELGALICKPSRPECPSCPLREECAALATGRVEELPVPKPAKASRELAIPLYLLFDDAGRVLMRRESGPLMNAMYHLPHGAALLLPAVPLNVRRRSLLGSFRHTITDRRIAFSVWTAEAEGKVADSGGDYEWIDPASLGQVPHPSYVKKALALLKKSPAVIAC